MPLIRQKQHGKEVRQNQYARFAENADVLANCIPDASREAESDAAIFFIEGCAERERQIARDFLPVRAGVRRILKGFAYIAVSRACARETVI